MTKKQILRSIAFVLAACCVLCLLCDLFERDNDSNIDRRFTTFRSLEENTLDAVWLGTSGVDRYWIAGKAYDEYGMTVYPLTSDAMPAWLYVDLIKDVYTRQTPKLIIIDARVYGQGNSTANKMEVQARRVLDAMAFPSRSHMETARTTMEVIHTTYPVEPAFRLSYLLPFVKYHTKWEEDDYSFALNLGDQEHFYGGFFLHETLSIKVKKQKPVPYNKDIYYDIGTPYLNALYALLDYAQAQNIELLFVDTPRYKTEEKMGKANTLYKILDERGINYINYCETDADGRHFINVPELRRSKDFYNSGHVNYYGAEKFTAVFSKYLAENYTFDNHWKDEAVMKDWDGIYSRIKRSIQENEAQKALPVPEEPTTPDVGLDLNYDDEILEEEYGEDFTEEELEGAVDAPDEDLEEEEAE